MERVTIEVVQHLLDKFYVSFLDMKDFGRIPSTEGIIFYEGVDQDIKRSIFKVFYNKEKFLNLSLDEIEDEDSFKIKDSIDIYPDFYIKNIEELEEYDGSNGYIESIPGRD